MRNVEPKTWDTVRPGMVQGLASTNGIYSAWNWNKGQYDYYESPTNQRPNYGGEVAPPPTNNAFGSALGEDPDRSSHQVPRSAEYVGSGPVAIGEIVSIADNGTSINPWIGVALALVIPTALLYVTVKFADIFGTRREDTEVGF